MTRLRGLVSWKEGMVIKVESGFLYNRKDVFYLKYIGDGYLEDINTGRKIWVDTNIYPKIFEGFTLNLAIKNDYPRDNYEITYIEGISERY